LGVVREGKQERKIGRGLKDKKTRQKRRKGGRNTAGGDWRGSGNERIFAPWKTQVDAEEKGEIHPSEKTEREKGKVPQKVEPSAS